MKNSNKGFTLVEIIIAIAIFTVVITLGYNLVNDTNKSVAASKITIEGQSSANIVNKYLTKDLEKSDPNNFIMPTQDQINSGTYRYIIKTNGFYENNHNLLYIKYTVNVGGNKYSITRETYENQDDLNRNISKSSIDIIKNQPIDNSNNKPFEIMKSSQSDIYTVSMQYKDKNNKIYTFNVSSRHNEFAVGGGQVGDGSPENPLPPDPEPEVDPDMKDLNGFLRFGYKHTINPMKKNAFASVGSSKVTNNEEKEYKRVYIEDSKNVYDIYSELSFNNANRKVNTWIDNSKNKVDVQESDFGQMSINSINVTVLGDIECTLTINQKVGGQNKDLYKNVNLNKVGKYTFSVEDTSIDGKDIIISGNITKPSDGTFGEIIITFGTKK